MDASGDSYFGALAYTNAGQNIGPALDPNSDRITLQAKSRNIGGATVSGVFRLIRHGNASRGRQRIYRFDERKRRRLGRPRGSGPRQHRDVVVADLHVDFRG